MILHRGQFQKEWFHQWFFWRQLSHIEIHSGVSSYNLFVCWVRFWTNKSSKKKCFFGTTKSAFAKESALKSAILSANKSAQKITIESTFVLSDPICVCLRFSRAWKKTKLCDCLERSGNYYPFLSTHSSTLVRKVIHKWLVSFFVAIDVCLLVRVGGTSMLTARRNFTSWKLITKFSLHQQSLSTRPCRVRKTNLGSWNFVSSKVVLSAPTTLKYPYTIL